MLITSLPSYLYDRRLPYHWWVNFHEKTGSIYNEKFHPTVADRIAQMVVKDAIEPDIEKCFHPDSYGYRPGRSAHQAVATARSRCWKRP
jgi:retron-type reverse transcriptase